MPHNPELRGKADAVGDWVRHHNLLVRVLSILDAARDAVRRELDQLGSPAADHPETQGSSDALYDLTVQEKLDRMCGPGPC